MWSKVALLCVLAATVYTSNSPAWKDNTEYIYTVRGRTLTSLNDIADQYSGIQLKSKLHLTLKSNGNLQGRISEPQYAQIHTRLPKGWEQFISESELNYKPLAWTDKPFEMEVENGLINGLIVEKELTNWEVNMIKSIVSQFQLDVQGQNAIDSPINIQGHNNDAVFKTYEETITGRTETTYDIHQLREYYMQEQPELVPQRHLKGDGDVIEVIKTKNFTNSQERPSYHFGLKEIKEKEPTDNSVEELLTRSCESRAILTGKLSQFTIQSVFTVDKIFISPTWSHDQMGSVVSALNISLYQVQTNSGEHQELSNPIKVGDLVYSFENPSSSQAENKRYGSEESSVENRDSEEHMRYRRFAPQMIEKLNKQGNLMRQLEQEQPTPKMEYAPELPLLPYFIGYHGKSIKESGSFDLKQQVKKITQDISNDLQNSESILKGATLSKYTILSSLMRLMNEEELRSVAEEIFSQSQQQGQKDLFAIFRDAVAETGTGPAFLTIQQWIETKKIKNQEAAAVVATMAANVRTPTFEYMSKFYELVRSQQSQSRLNETALLSYTNLVYQVYVNKNFSHNQYPVHTFGQFRNQETNKFVQETIIPYLSQQLDKAVLEADTRKIHVYIHALGNVGHKQILPAFEKYLEGEKQCSQFQRLMMVISLDKLATAYPEIARAVLYRIYQNSGELQQIRVAAVFQIMRTQPPKEMIQHMAQHTHFEKQREVNGAVKSAIENLCQLRSPKHEYLRQAGESAKHLMTKRMYGYTNSMSLKDYVAEGMESELVHHLQTMSTAESYWPNAIKFTLNKNMNKAQFLNFESMVSSIKELIDVLEQQTQSYQQQQQESSQQGGQSKYSSSNVAQMLNLDINQKEQLEGFIYSELDIFTSMLSFDNRTLERLPEFIREQEEKFRNGREFAWTKMGHAKEVALSFPTVMGLPFLYTYDAPLLIKVQGKTKMVASPAISQSGTIVRPNEVSGEIESEIILTGKVESHLSFITPFDHQQYFAGYNRNLQLAFPIKAQIKVDLKNKQAKIELDTSNLEKRRIVHYSSWPYTSRSDIMTTTPVALRPNTQYIQPQQPRHYDVTIGEKSTGIAFKIWGNHVEHSINLGELTQVYRTQGAMAVWQRLIKNGHMEQAEFNVVAVPEQTSTKRVTLRFSHLDKYVKSEESQNEDVSQWFTQDFSEQSQRQQEMSKMTSSGLRSADVSSCDMQVEFSGQKDKQYSATVGFGKSNVHPRSNVFFYLRRSMGQQVEQAAFQVKAEIPNTNGLDMVYALENQPSAKYQYKLYYQNSQQQKSELQGQVEMKRSQERKQYLVEQPEYQECKREIQQGQNHQLEACLNMTIRANFFDRYTIEMKPKNWNEQVQRIVKELYNAAKVYYYPASEVSYQGSQDEAIRMEVKFQPNFNYFNVTVQNSEEKLKIQDIYVNHLFQQVVMAHPVYHLKSRIFRHTTHFRRSCVVDNTAARTFNGLTYPTSSFNDWTVVLQYVPKQAKQQQESVSQQLKQQVENFVVLARKEQQQKEVKIVFNSPATQGKEVEITLRSNANGAPSVKVNDQELKLSNEEYEYLYNGYVQAYLLPNNEVKVELRNVFYIIFDGERVRITTLGDKFRDSVVGLCGRNGNDVHDDLFTPQNCIVATPYEFVEAYKTEGQKRFQADQKQCITPQQPLYVDVISSGQSGNLASEHRGARLQTRYVEQDGKICFTTRAMPVCKHQALSTINKEVPVHCVQNSRTAQLFVKQIQNGGSPDFSQKQVTRMIRMEVDQQCA